MKIDFSSVAHKFFIAVMAFLISSKVGASDEKTPPIEVPFYPQKVGSVYIFDVNVVEQLTYAIDVRFYLKLPNKWSHFFDKDLDPQEAKKFYEILGGARLVNHEWVEPGVPAKFRVQIINKASKKIILNELISRPATSAAYMGRYAVLANANLPIGLYEIRLEYLEGASELWPLYAKIWFARAHHGK